MTDDRKPEMTDAEVNARCAAYRGWIDIRTPRDRGWNQPEYRDRLDELWGTPPEWKHEDKQPYMPIPNFCGWWHAAGELIDDMCQRGDYLALSCGTGVIEPFGSFAWTALFRQSQASGIAHTGPAAIARAYLAARGGK
jgi:hypothetical protein